MVFVSVNWSDRFWNKCRLIVSGFWNRAKFHTYCFWLHFFKKSFTFFQSLHSEVELSETQQAFQEIVDVIYDHEDHCNGRPKKDLSKQIKLVADEVVKSKIRDKLLLASKADRSDVNTKLAQLKVSDEKKEDGKDLKLKQQVVSQATAIANQAKLLDTLMKRTETLSEENDNLRGEIDNLRGEIDNLNNKIKTSDEKLYDFVQEIENLKKENLKLKEKNAELMAQFEEISQ